MTDFCNDIDSRIDNVIDNIYKLFDNNKLSEKNYNEWCESNPELEKIIDDLRDIREDTPCDCEVED